MRVLLVFDGIIADMEFNKKLSPKVTELFLKRRKLNISLIFVSQSYFKVPKTITIDGVYKILEDWRVESVNSI